MPLRPITNLHTSKYDISAHKIYGHQEFIDKYHKYGVHNLKWITCVTPITYDKQAAALKQIPGICKKHVYTEKSTLTMSTILSKNHHKLGAVGIYNTHQEFCTPISKYVTQCMPKYENIERKTPKQDEKCTNQEPVTCHCPSSLPLLHIV